MEDHLMAGSEPETDVVIGAASGMGVAVARVLATRGRRLVLADRDGPAVASVASALGAEHLECDVTEPDSIGRVRDAVGGFGALVVTAGLSPAMADGPRIVDVNLVGSAAVLRQFEPAAAPGSVAVLFASIAAYQLPVDAAVDAIVDAPESPSLLEELGALGLLDHPGIAYAVSKRGVVRLVERCAGDWGARGARLVSVSPGIIDTPMGRLESVDPIAHDLVQRSALGRMGTAEEVAAVVGFLTSAQASFVTGADVLVDGGAVARQRGPAPGA